MNAVYSKSLKLSSAAKQQSTTGETGECFFIIQFEINLL
jgi:hypothetical protein